MFNIKVDYCPIHNKVMCELEWIKDEDANVREHLFTFDPYWLSSLENSIRIAEEDLESLGPIKSVV